MAEPDSTPSDDAESKDSRDVAVLKNVQAIKEAYGSLLPVVPEDIDKGTLSVEDGETVAGSLLVHHAIRRLAEQVKKGVVAHNPQKNRVVLVKSLDQASASYGLALVGSRLKELTERARSLVDSLESPPSLIPKDEMADSAPATLIDPVSAGAIAAVAGGVVDLLIKATQSNISIREGAVAVLRSAPVAPVVDRLVSTGVPVVLDETVAIVQENAVVVALIGLLSQRNRLLATALWTRTTLVEGEYARLIGELTVLLSSLRDALKDAEEPVRDRLESDILSAEKRRATLQDAVDLATYKAKLAEATVVSIDEFVVTISTPNSDGATPLQTAALHATLTDDDLMLFIDLANAGGGSLWKKTLGPDRALHQSGAAMTWMLFNRSGDIVAAGVEAALSSYGTKPDEPLKLNEATVSSIST